jgi:AbiV family abortive infection protein
MSDVERHAIENETMPELRQKPSSQGDNSQAFEALVSDILSRKVSLFDLLRSAPSGDYFAFIQQMRLFHVVSRDLRVLNVFREEIGARILEARGIPNDGSIERELARKDGARRFPKLLDERARAFDGQPSLLTGETFETCLEQYKALVAYVEKVWTEACQLYSVGNYPLAAFLSILVIEETGKLSRLPKDLLFYDVPRPPASGAPIDKSHRRKHFIGVVSGALINARLDRVLGKDFVRKVLHLAESDELEKIRQSCLYIDFLDRKAVTPSDVIDAERARVFTVLAGELMAEVLGYFPWEFERMLDSVIAFERATGMPEAKISRR